MPEYDQQWSRTTPMRHQRIITVDCLHRPACGLFLQQGTGKTKIVLDRAVALFLEGRIDGLLVVAPNGVHRNWVNEEAPKHLPEQLERKMLAHTATQSKRYQQQLAEVCAPGAFRLFAINVEAMSTARGVQLAEKFLSSGRMLMVVDESTSIKTPTARRTRSLIRTGARAVARMIATGTPVTQGPLDLYSQFQFLLPGYLGPTFTVFKNRYAEWAERRLASGHRFRELIRYRNLDELIAKVDALSYQITKAECLDLPEKVYERRPVVLGEEQMRAYHAVRASVLASLSGDERVTTHHTLTRLLRLHQIAGGFIQLDDCAEVKPLPNAKIEALRQLLADTDNESKVIIYAKFVPELRAISEMLAEEYGSESVGRYWGEISNDEREATKVAFQELPAMRFFVGQPQTAGLGITLTAASMVVYYSNTFSLLDRLQSEDRAHRHGQTKSVTYVDLVAEGTIDEKVIAALRNKQDLAEMFKTVKEILA